MCACVLSHFSRVQLCDTIDCSLPGSSVHGILQARILEWVAVLSSRLSSRSRGPTCVSYVYLLLAGRFSTASTTWEALSLTINKIKNSVKKVRPGCSVLFPLSFPDSPVGKESACNAGDSGQFLGWEDLLEKG